MSASLVSRISESDINIDELITIYLSYVDKIISYIPYKRVKVWKEFFLKPEEKLESSITSTSSIIVDLYVMSLLSMFIGLLNPLVIILIAINPLVFVIVLALFLLLPILYILHSLLEFIVARIVGGKAGFRVHLNASVLPLLGMWAVLLLLSIIQIPIGILSYIPVISCIVTPFIYLISGITMILYIYTLYIKFIAFKKAHGISGIKSAAVVIVPLLIEGVILLILLSLMLAYIITTIQYPPVNV
ncbi:MAG: hypothetical protein ACP5KJ_01500 [Candidatus Micrarchaeia archaeon]